MPPPLPPPAPPPPVSPDPLPLVPTCDHSCLFVSEFVEAGPSSANTFIELYNGCDSSLLLGNYRLLICRDGCPTATAGATGQPADAKQVALPSAQWLLPGSTYSVAYCEPSATLGTFTRSCASGPVLTATDMHTPDLGDGNDWLRFQRTSAHG